MNQAEMTAKIERGDGFIAALDQSGGSTPKALKGYGIEEGAWSSDEEMFDLIHQMRERIITSPCFGSGKVIGAILFERTMDGTVDGKPTPQALIERGIVPFIKIDKGLEAEENGVQLMKPMPELDTLLERAKVARRLRDQGAVGHQRGQSGRHRRRRSRSSSRSRSRCSAHGLMPIIEPEVNIKSADRAESDDLLLTAILEELDELPEGQRVMLKLSIPAEAGLVRAARRPSQGASRRRAVRRLSAARRPAASWRRTRA